jgi:predicted nucleic acid-binding protein
VIVVDASVLSDALTGHGDVGEVARQRLRQAGELAAPDHVDAETVSSFRKKWFSGDLSDVGFSQAIDNLRDFRITRYPVLRFMRRAYALRSNVNPYDASYVALAEALDCVLVTGDARLAKAPGPTCQIEVVAA